MESEDETALFLAASHDAIPKTPNANIYADCPSCGNTVSGNFCNNCGQKIDDMRRSLFALIAETLGGIFSFESRMWKTFGALLFKPGKVAREYADGARMRYSAPVRTYLVVSILFFSFMSMTSTHFLSFEILPKDTSQTTQVETTEESNTENTIQNEAPLDPLQLKTQPKKKRNVSFSSNLPANETNIFSIGDEIVKIRFFAKGSDLHKPTKEEVQGITGSLSDDLNVSINDEALDREKIVNALFANPKQFNATFNTWLPRMMFFMVPFAMILGWLFIRGPNAMLIDHLIHAIYLQSTLFIAVLSTVILSQFISSNILMPILTAVLILYFMLSLKRMFKRGWIKTIWTTLVGGFMYVLILLAIMTGITIAAFANIASFGT